MGTVWVRKIVKNWRIVELDSLRDISYTTLVSNSLLIETYEHSSERRTTYEADKFTHKQRKKQGSGCPDRQL